MEVLEALDALERRVTDLLAEAASLRNREPAGLASAYGPEAEALRRIDELTKALELERQLRADVFERVNNLLKRLEEDGGVS